MKKTKDPGPDNKTIVITYLSLPDDQGRYHFEVNWHDDRHTDRQTHLYFADPRPQIAQYRRQGFKIQSKNQLPPKGDVNV